MIRFNHISKKYGEHSVALDDVSIDISDGEFVFLIGPSGAGKTTLLRLLIRDMLPTKGSVLIDDWELNTLEEKQVHLLRRKVGMVFQDFKLLTDRTVFENVAIGLEILGKPLAEIEKGVNDILELVSLTNKKDQFPLQLSAGELQRISIARAIVGGPKILLADEPTGNLDPQTAWEILNILEQVNKIGTTIIMATHNVNIVNELKKRTITLKHGKIVSDEVKGRYHLSEKHRDIKSVKKEHGN
jgi:cell division transport system ATP-binding protein